MAQRVLFALPVSRSAGQGRPAANLLWNRQGGFPRPAGIRQRAEHAVTMGSRRGGPASSGVPSRWRHHGRQHPRFSFSDRLRWFLQHYPDFRRDWATATHLDPMIQLLAYARHAGVVNPEYDACVRRTICWCSEQADPPASAQLRDYFAIVWLHTRGFIDKDKLESYRRHYCSAACGATVIGLRLRRPGAGAQLAAWHAMDGDVLDGAQRAVWACDRSAEFRGITDLRPVHAAQADYLRRQLPHPLEVPVDDGPNHDGKYRVTGYTTKGDDPNELAVYCYICVRSIPNTTRTVLSDGRKFICGKCGKLLGGRGRSGEVC